MIRLQTVNADLGETITDLRRQLSLASIDNDFEIALQVEQNEFEPKTTAWIQSPENMNGDGEEKILTQLRRKSQIAK